jgi:sporulation protein YpjB
MPEGNSLVPKTSEREECVIKVHLRWMGKGLAVILLWLTVHPAVAQAEGVEREKEEWSQLAGKIERKVESEQWLAAREDLGVLARRFSQADWLAENLSLEAVHNLSEVLMELEWGLNQVRPNRKELSQAAERMLLAFDALSHPNQPLWQRFYLPMKEEVVAAKQAIGRKDRQRASQAIEALHQKAQLVRPALIVAKSPFAVHKMDSLIAFMRKEKRLDRLAAALGQLEQLLYPLFYGTERDVMATVHRWKEGEAISLTYWLALMIVTVLAYVAWLRYRAESNPAPT